MITTVHIKINANAPSLPLAPFALFEGSALTVKVEGVPRPVGKQKVDAVSVAVKNAAGETLSVAAVLSGGLWTATFEGSHFASSGFVGKGVTVIADGTDEHGDAVEGWILGKGDLMVLEADGTIRPGEVIDEMRWHDAAPEAPRKGDVAPVGGTISLWDGEEWRALGGGSSSVSWDDVTGKPDAFPPEAHTHAQSDVTGLATALADKLDKSGGELSVNAEIHTQGVPGGWSHNIHFGTKQDSYENAIWVTDSAGNLMYKLSDTISGIESFAFIRNAAGGITLQAALDGKVSKLKNGTQEITPTQGVADVSTLFSNENTAGNAWIDSRLPYPINTAGTILDRNINVVTSGAWTIPSGFKDLLIRYTGTPTSLTFAETGITDYGDDLPSESGDYLVTVTRVKASEAYIRVVKLEGRN